MAKLVEESTWATLCAGVIAADRRVSVYRLPFGVILHEF